MTENEAEILDELYFVISFSKLKTQLFGIDESQLKSELEVMFNKGWLNFYIELDGEINPKINLQENIESLYFLISKKGLFAHNSR